MVSSRGADALFELLHFCLTYRTVFNSRQFQEPLVLSLRFPRLLSAITLPPTETPILELKYCEPGWRHLWMEGLCDIYC